MLFSHNKNHVINGLMLLLAKRTKKIKDFYLLWSLIDMKEHQPVDMRRW